LFVRKFYTDNTLPGLASLICSWVLAMPAKRYEKRVIDYLSRAEIEALIEVPDLTTWHGRRDRALLALVDRTVETTQMYIHADIQLKEKAMARTRPVKTTPGRYCPDDKLLAFLRRSDYADMPRWC
jgi:hypothetical protein